jgi:hypothetical protein
MYVATCYQNISWLEKYDYAFAAGATDYPTLQPWITKILLDWNRRDPVSEGKLSVRKLFIVFRRTETLS